MERSRFTRPPFLPDRWTGRSSGQWRRGGGAHNGRRDVERSAFHHPDYPKIRARAKIDGALCNNDGSITRKHSRPDEEKRSPSQRGRLTGHFSAIRPRRRQWRVGVRLATAVERRTRRGRRQLTCHAASFVISAPGAGVRTVGPLEWSFAIFAGRGTKGAPDRSGAGSRGQTNARTTGPAPEKRRVV